jgi:1,4-dihydroxy-2-naphthoate octaprenyltransferase
MINNWIIAIRPKTLWASVAPVLIGTVMAYYDQGTFHVPSAFMTLLGALLIQVGTNFTNDYFDFKKGADTFERMGPARVMQTGLISSRSMKIAIGTIGTLAIIVGIYLVWRGGWPIAFIGIASLLSGFLYTAGPYPLAYLGLGDLFVLIFFGPVAVAGTYYVQTLDINPAVIVAGIPPGLLSVAILTVNNLRDAESDRKAGKKTWAVRFGGNFSKIEYIAAILLAALIPLFFLKENFYVIFTLIIIPLAIPSIRTILKKSDGPALNTLLAQTGKLLLIYSLLFSIGWIL